MECEFCGSQLYEVTKERQANCISCGSEHKWSNGKYVPVWRNHHTVCQVIREIHALSMEDVVKEKCALAIRMTKRLHDNYKKLRDENETLRKERI